jgi:hypothetical protein
MDSKNKGSKVRSQVNNPNTPAREVLLIFIMHLTLGPFGSNTRVVWVFGNAPIKGRT